MSVGFVGDKGLVRGAALAVMLAVVLTALGVRSLLVSAQGPPPLPIFFSGEVYLEGEPVAGPAELTVRIDGWESAPVTVVDGSFRCGDPCLTAGPPDQSYIGERVTFHLNGTYEADYSFDFPAASQPDVRTVELHFSAVSGASSMMASPIMWGVAVSLSALVIAGGSWFFLRARGRSPSIPPYRTAASFL